MVEEFIDLVGGGGGDADRLTEFGDFGAGAFGEPGGEFAVEVFKVGCWVGVGVAEACGTLLQDDDGLDAVLSIIATSLPHRLYDTAYALAVEVAAADLHVEQEELRFLQLLRDALDLDKLTVAAIERGALARYRTLSDGQKKPTGK